MSRSLFDAHYDEALKRAQDIKGQRGEQYNRTDPIRNYWVYGLQSIYHCIWAKALRLRSLLGIHVNWISPIEKDGATFEDSCLDIINYAAFLYAENRCRWLTYTEKMRMENEAKLAERFAAVNNPGPSNPVVERVVLDPGQGQSSRGTSGSDHEFSPLHEGCPTCTDVLKGARPDTGDGPHDLGNIEHPQGLAGTDGSDQKSSVLLRDDEGGGQKPVR